MESKYLLGKFISHLGKDVHCFLREKLEKHNLGSGQLRVVMKIHENEGITQDQLSKMIGIDKTTIAKSIKKVINEGYIIKERDSEDKRCYRLYTTDNGKKVYPVIRGIFQEAEKIIISGFTEDELKLFISFMDRVRDNLKPE